MECADVFVAALQEPTPNLGQPEVRKWVDHLRTREPKLGPQRLRQHFAALRFLYGKTLGRPEVTSFLSWPKDPRTLPVVLSEQQVHRLLGAFETPRMRMFFMTVYAAGLRIGEACRLETGDIDAEQGIIRVRHGKGGKERLVMLSPRLLVLLRAYWKQELPAAPWLFAAGAVDRRARRASAPRSTFSRGLHVAG